ncbi:MAG: DUF6062 family protein [Clostridia bacterium]
MKYHIDTIPVWDAYKADSECPLCALRTKTEAMYLDNFLGASVMEPDVRVEVNEKGFCAAHYAQMITAKNRLGLALMTHTHWKQTLQRVAAVSASLRGQAKDFSDTPAMKRLLSRTARLPMAEQAQALDAAHNTCILCDRLNATMERYLYTVLHLWKTDTAFRQTFAHSKGLCLPHLAQICEMAVSELDASSCQAFLDMLLSLQAVQMERLEKELEWFTLKFDYRNTEKPWGNSKDALERVINKLQGKCVGME